MLYYITASYHTQSTVPHRAVSTESYSSSMLGKNMFGWNAEDICKTSVSIVQEYVCPFFCNEIKEEQSVAKECGIRS